MSIISFLGELIQPTRQRLGHLLHLGSDAAEEQEVIDGIVRGIEFRGAKLWILVLAIFVASLGLNTNSAAVIIGAMLISPLMGPIIGMGLGAGIYDFDILRRSWNNYIVATIFSILTATFYFLITPIAQAQSELLARTSPTIYDVMIALCGGLAGIIALGSKSQRTGNVIPGVAIATALMPPLCTVGFGIATANWAYALGALYLFVINTIFIATATFIGAVFIMRFHRHRFVDPVRERRVKRIIYTLAIVTIVPAVVLTFGMVRQGYFEQRVNRFVKTEMRFPSTEVLSCHADFKTRSFNVVLLGAEVDSLQLEELRQRLPYYMLSGVKMNVLQGSSNIDANELRALIHSRTGQQTQNEELVAQHQAVVNDLEQRLQAYHDVESSARTLCNEMQTLFPQVVGVSIARGYAASTEADSTQILTIVDTSTPVSNTDTERLTQWMKQRTGHEDMRIIFTTKK